MAQPPVRPAAPSPDPARRTAALPAVGRRELNALKASGHGSDTILIGETASGGITRPLTMLQAMYCVNGANRPLRGAAAAALGCPSSGNRTQFVAAHPGLFAIGGWAHHPYSFDQPPNRRYNLPGAITLQNLGSLEREINRVFALDGRSRRGGVPLYLTEFGYKSIRRTPSCTHRSASRRCGSTRASTCRGAIRTCGRWRSLSSSTLPHRRRARAGRARTGARSRAA